MLHGQQNIKIYKRTGSLDVG